LRIILVGGSGTIGRRLVPELAERHEIVVAGRTSHTLTEEQLLDNMRGKFFGQSFTLTSGVFADVPAKRVTGGAVVSGALHSFVLSAALELEGRYRVNVVSPTIVGDSVDEYADLFPGLSAVPMATLVQHYVTCIEGDATGQIIRAYG